MIKATASADVTVKRPYKNIKARLQLISRPSWKKGSPASFGNLMSLERSTCNFIYKSLHIWNQICFHLHFKALLVKIFLEKKTYMTQIVINKIPASMTLMNDQRLVVINEDQYILVHRNRLSLENNSLHRRTSKGATMLRTSSPPS